MMKVKHLILIAAVFLIGGGSTFLLALLGCQVPTFMVYTVAISPLPISFIALATLALLLVTKGTPRSLTLGAAMLLASYLLLEWMFLAAYF